MCDPMTAAVVIGTVASAGATYKQSRDANKNLQRQQDAKNQAFREGLDRQHGYQQESSEAFAQNLRGQGQEGYNQQLEDSTEKRMQAFNDSRIQGGDYNVPVLASSPKNVVIAQNQAFGEAEAESKQQSDALARLSGYGDAGFNQGLANNAYKRAFGNIADEAGRDARLVGLDINAASNNAFKPTSPIVPLVKAAGQMASSYGAANMSAGATPPPDGIRMNGYDPNLPWKTNGQLRGYQ